MAISDRKSLSVGAGISILTAIAGIFSSYLRQHWGYLVAAGIFAMVLMTWPLLHTIFANKTIKETKPSSKKTQIAGGDVIGKMFQAEELHYHEAVQLPQQVAPPPTAPPRMPNFHWSFRYARLIFSDGIWRETQSRVGFQAIVADIALPAHRQNALSDPTVYGAIQIKGSSSKFAKRPYWIDECANEMRYEIGHAASLVVLCFQSDIEKGTFDWVVYQNPLNSIPDHPFWNRPKELGKRVALAIDQSPCVVISLVDAYSTSVLDRRAIRLTVSDSIWNIEELPNEA